MDAHFLCIYMFQFFLSMQIVWALDNVMLLNPPSETVPDHLMKIHYSCDEPSIVQLDCILTFETGAISKLLLGQWYCLPGHPKIRLIKLILPDWLVYKADATVSDSHWVLICILRATVKYNYFSDSEAPVVAQDVATLQPKPFFSRPVKQHQSCSDWSAPMLRISRQSAQGQCPMEQETVHFLSTIYASTGESFGITKTLDPYMNHILESLRIKDIVFPWCSVSIWIFVTRHCREDLCGLFYHIDPHNEYVTPTVLLRKSGQLHIQMTGESKTSSAFLSPFRVPINDWCQLRLMLQGRTVSLSMMCINNKQNGVQYAEHLFLHAVTLDDTKGYFVIGGGKFVQGVEGYFGPIVLYRNRIPSYSTSDIFLPDVVKNVNLTGWLQTCQEFRLEMIEKIGGYSQSVIKKTQYETCHDVFHEWKVSEGTKSGEQCEMWEATAPQRRAAAKLAELLSFKSRKAVSLQALGKALYFLSLDKLSRARSSAVVSRILPLLLQAGCLDNNQALHMSSILLSTGLGVHKQPNKSLSQNLLSEHILHIRPDVWLLALLAAQRDNRLALLHLGYLHHQGLLGLPVDSDLAYGYYANIAHQTTLDRHNHTSEQTFVEAIYLNNDDVLNHQTNEDHHIFQWLKLQARRGAAEAEQSIARMLFWGQQGVSPNIQEAVRHYQRGAVHLQDPVSMYDYGIVLLQGHGVDKDIPKALTFLKKAKEQGFVPAINALAWYYEHYEQDYKQAVQLWEEADLLGCPEAAMNLGVMYSQGLYPGKPANEYLAYSYYSKSAERGHIRGAVTLADILTTGIPNLVARRPTDAVLWVKWAAEHNGYLGSILRKALDSYLKNEMLSSLLYYTIAAKSGFASAQFNLAYLCEQNPGSFLDSVYASQCMWKYYNLTIQSQNPDTYAFIRMGDLFYEGHGDRPKDLFSAALMYKMAALRGDPQGWYNLGLLSEGGQRLSFSILSDLGLSELYLADNNILPAVLYKRCRDSEKADSFFPCSLALFNVYFKSFQKDYSAAIRISTALAVVAAPTAFLIVLTVLRRRTVSLT